MRRTAALLATAATLAGTILCAPAAFAVGPHQTPDPTQEGRVCPYQDWYDGIVNQGKSIVPVGASQANYNGTSHDATSTFSAQVSGTVSYTVSASMSVSIGTIIADASATVGVSLSTSLTASLGNSTTVTASPGQTAHATYGVWRLQTYGTYHVIREDCSSSVGGVTAYSPWYVGWNTWVS
ncbi:hypothetical protein HUT16_37210 [Kitasatospora sp. NA04385]|uniref:hypothetical protein n=1 Tax=Kitasatospora sp. NA04385 TaxID=2742135 RepID=UPI0015914A61|nr:hypothetical protein [Kitasatospora sp. NA04385]QKW23974.1 hypothetical protein HUT16_37210 [Kitasatospora sp. NA04385]